MKVKLLPGVLAGSPKQKRQNMIIKTCQILQKSNGLKEPVKESKIKNIKSERDGNKKSLKIAAK